MKDNNDISQELLEAIERYINGTMNAKELKDFNEYLKIDDEFKTQVEDIKTMLLGIETQSLKEQLNIFHEEIEDKKTHEPQTKNLRFLNYSKIAATAAILIVFGSIWFFSRSPNQRLYSAYFKPASGLPTSMNHNSDHFDFYNAMNHYNHGDYELAIQTWKILSEKQINNDTLNYFLGVAHLANKNGDDAIPFLERTVESKNTFPLINDAYYYLGLAYLNEDNVILAKKYFNLSNTADSKELIKLLE
ncbi:hypothetical protein APS56_06430 [Pseudalgibacter alginicilyticus]|uniref:Tetratricopeptide repeat protein n=1 Tax=Pseudalgibacter alginicilyticus TaxID=1736674 RepID=A0A0P0D9Z6_9FLAO|nr:tetratricopeptide repeat protein [Pseudalgibacter alginicilyticus]ALJ04780.1 hypothetical protein APS56_06430 [Pseudalgibacter alginicilyticus]